MALRTVYRYEYISLAEYFSHNKLKIQSILVYSTREVILLINKGNDNYFHVISKDPPSVKMISKIVCHIEGSAAADATEISHVQFDH